LLTIQCQAELDNGPIANGCFNFLRQTGLIYLADGYACFFPCTAGIPASISVGMVILPTAVEIDIIRLNVYIIRCFFEAKQQ